MAVEDGGSGNPAEDPGENAEPGLPGFDEEQGLGDEEGPSHAWLPPDDRLWRHPSEVASAGLPIGPGAPSPGTAAPVPTAGGRSWGAVISAGVVGALMAGGVATIIVKLTSSPTETARETASHAAGTTLATVNTGPGIGQMAAKIAPALVGVEVTTPSGERRGTGLIYRSNGTILTADTLVSGATAITVETSTGREQGATLRGEDPYSDLAVLSVDANNLPTVTLANSDVAVGDLTVVVATSYGDDRPTPAVYALGMVRSVGQAVQLPSGKALLDMIETDAPLGTATGGGVLLDQSGHVVGMTAGIAGPSTGSRCVATPASDLVSSANQLIARGWVTYGWIGVVGSDLSEAQARSNGVSAGVEVQKVVSGSPAAAAGVHAGEAIVSVNGAPVGSILDLQAKIHPMSPGQKITLGVADQGRQSGATATVAAAPN